MIKNKLINVIMSMVLLFSFSAALAAGNKDYLHNQTTKSYKDSVVKNVKNNHTHKHTCNCCSCCKKSH